MNATDVYKRIEQRQAYLDKRVRELRDKEQYDLAEKYAYASAELECIRHFIAEGM